MSTVAVETLTLDESGRWYLWGGRKLPRVTDVLKVVSTWNGYPTDAAARGTYVHRCAELNDEGCLDYSALESVWKGYVDAWNSFLVKEGLDAEEMILERKIKSLEHGFAGTMDRYFPALGLLVDIKTGGIYDKPHLLQAAAYWIGIKEDLKLKPKRALNVYLKPDGRFEPRERKIGRQEIADFLSCLRVWQLKNT